MSKKFALILFLVALPSVAKAAQFFDGADDRLFCGTSTNMIPATNQISIAAWVNVNNVLSNVVFGRTAISNAEPYFFRVQIGAGIRLAIKTGGVVTQVSGGPTLAIGRWYHIAGTWDGANVRLYTDGVLVAGPTAKTGTFDVNAATAAVGILDQGTIPFGGLMDDLRVYSRALSASEIATLAGSRSRQPPEDGMFLYLPMDEYPDGTAVDGMKFVDRSTNRFTCTGDDGANNTGLIARGSTWINYQ